MLGRVAIPSAMTLAPFTSSSASEDCPPQEQDLAALKTLLVKNPEILARQEAGVARPRFLAVMGTPLGRIVMGEDRVGVLGEAQKAVLVKELKRGLNLDLLTEDAAEELVRSFTTEHQIAKDLREVEILTNTPCENGPMVADPEMPKSR